jgi:leader peptidase (prepilin peptidase)/N-methyltransferase
LDALATRDPRVVAVAAVAIGSLVVAAPIAGASAIAVLVPAAVVDVEQRRLPDAWIGAGLVVLVVALALEGAIGQPIDGGNPVAGALAMALPLLVLHLVSPTSMGFGDVKATVVLGAAVGTIDWRLGAVALCIAALTAALTGGLTRRHAVPFGPFLVLGAGLALLAHGPIVDAVFNSEVTP